MAVPSVFFLHETENKIAKLYVEMTDVKIYGLQAQPNDLYRC